MQKTLEIHKTDCNNMLIQDEQSSGTIALNCPIRKMKYRQDTRAAETCRISAAKAKQRNPQSYEIHWLFSERRISSEMKSGRRSRLRKFPLS